MSKTEQKKSDEQPRVEKLISVVLIRTATGKYNLANGIGETIEVAPALAKEMIFEGFATYPEK